MILRFVLPDESLVEYGMGPNTRVPLAGEGVVSDGTDPDFPAGIYVALDLTTHVGLRGGPNLIVCPLRWVYDNPAASPRDLAKEDR